jgi:putative ABC transport system permease protein
VSFMPLGYGDIALAAVLIGLNAVLFIWLRLRLERQLVIAALRMLVQFSLLAPVLKTLFELASPIYTGLAALAMVLFAGYEVLGRQQRRLAGWWAMASAPQVFSLPEQSSPSLPSPPGAA